jgi:hypothetical protein
VYVWVCTYVYARMYSVFMYVRMDTCMEVCMHTRICVKRGLQRITNWLFMHACLRVCVSVHAYVLSDESFCFKKRLEEGSKSCRVCVCVCVYVRMCIHPRMCVCVHACMHVHTHLRTHQVKRTARKQIMSHTRPDISKHPARKSQIH